MWLRLSGLTILLVTLAVMVLPKQLGAIFMPAYAQSNATEVVALTANWCANCRRVIPIVQEAARQKSVNVVVIDVDSPAAPRQAKPYGIAIAGESLPMVYVIQNGQAVKAITGNDYTYGRDDDVRGMLLSKLGG